MSWIKSDSGLRSHPKTMHLMALTGWSLHETIGRLHLLWHWCLEYAEDGDLRKYAPEVWLTAMNVDKSAQRVVFCAITKSSFVDRAPYIRIHDWWEHNGAYLRARYRQRPELWQKIQLKCETQKRRVKRNAPVMSSTVQDSIPSLPSEESLPSGEESHATAPGGMGRDGKKVLDGGNGGDGGGRHGRNGVGAGGDGGRVAEMVSILQRAGVKGVKLLHLANRRDLSPKIITDEIKDIERDSNVGDIAAVLVARLEKARRS